MRACLLATELARRAGLDEARQGEVYYATLLRFAGCAATSHEIAAALGVAESTIASRLAAAKGQLRRELGGDEDVAGGDEHIAAEPSR